MRHLFDRIKNAIMKENMEYKIIVLTLFLFVISLITLVILIVSEGKNEMDNLCKNISIDNQSLNRSLVLYFQFNNKQIYGENENLVCDLSGNNNHGIIRNATWNRTGGIYGDGAYQFNGINSEIKVRDSKTLSPETYDNHFSVSFFVKFENTSFVGQGFSKSYVNYIGKAKPRNYEWEFRQYNSSNPDGRPNRLSFYAFNKEGGFGSGGYVQENLNEGEWIFITGVIDGEVIKIYKNGILKNTQNLSYGKISIENTNSDLYIGTADRGAYFNGSIDELRIYNRSLSNHEIMSLYKLNNFKQNEIF